MGGQLQLKGREGQERFPQSISERKRKGFPKGFLQTLLPSCRCPW